MNEERAKQLLRRVREGGDPRKTKYSKEEISTKIGYWNTWRLLRNWSPKAKGKKAFFEIEKIRNKKYLNLISEVERKLINMEGFGSSIDLRITWKRMHLEGARIEARLKEHSWCLTLSFGLIFTLLGLVLTYLIFK